MGEFPHELTWYKKTEQTNVFERYVLNRISWQSSRAANIRKSGMLDADKATIYIPFIDDGGNSRADFEFGIGDWLVPGIAQEEMSSLSFTPTDLLKKYPRAVKICSVDLKDYGVEYMKHWEIGGA